MRFCSRSGVAGQPSDALAGGDVAGHAGLAPIIARSPMCTWSTMPTCPAITT